MKNIVILLLLSVGGFGCVYSQSNFVCTDEGGVAADGRTCRNGVWVNDGLTRDAGADLLVDTRPDGSTDAATDLPNDGGRDGGVDAAGDVPADMTVDEGPDLPAPFCGDNTVDNGEQCDDGGNVAGDGCDPQCQLEATLCGNGVLEFGELCDDGDTIDNVCDADCQGFSPLCTVASHNNRNYLFCSTLSSSTDANLACNALGYSLAMVRLAEDRTFFSAEASGRPSWWIEGTDAKQQYHWIRYDGARMPLFNTFFQISDQNQRCAYFDQATGNRYPGTCVLIAPFICEQRLCGNGTVDAATGEQCDDGNSADYDGCSSNCEVEVGFECEVSTLPRTATVCRQCGDGQLDANEGCDDGNQTAGDGCDASCQTEPGFTCLGGADGLSCAAVGTRVTDAEKDPTIESFLGVFGLSNSSFRTTGCEKGFLTGIFAQFTTNPFTRFRSIRGICAEVDVRNNLVHRRQKQSALTLAGDFQILEDVIECPEGQFVVGYRGYIDSFNGVATGLELVCSPIVTVGQTLDAPTPVIVGSVGNIQNNVLQIPQQTCPAGQLLSSMSTTTNDGAVGGTCSGFSPLCSTPQTCQ